MLLIYKLKNINKKLVGILDIIKAYEAGTRNLWEMAKFLGVTKNFLEECIVHYRIKYGICFEIDNYIIYFKPTLGVIKMF